TGEGKTECTGAIQKAIDDCGEAGGGTVLVPAGCYLTGPLILRSHVWLHLEPGATLRAITDIARWPVIPAPYAGKEHEREVYQPFIYAENASDIGVTGAGTIDGSGHVWWPEQVRNEVLKNRRPRLIAPNGCTNVTLEGVTVTNSPEWTINPVCCNNVRISGLTVQNPYNSPNTDGINPDSCRNVRISDCYIDVGDDCITIKSGIEDSTRPAGLSACENISITNCTMVHGHGAVVCGSEMSGDVRNVTISNCVFQGTDRGLRFKSRRGRGGIIENIRVSNIIMDKVNTPFAVNLFYFCDAFGESRVVDKHAYPVDSSTPRIERLHFSHITARDAQFAAGVFHGLPEMPILDITLHDIDVQMDPGAVEGETIMASTVAKMRKRAFFLRHVRGFDLQSVRIDGYDGHFVDDEDVEEMTGVPEK
ncbi:MAG: glycoside hydrolase family 28 protein, partial [Planctomycetes bacterium]|nr:glycoside hydrolase family 28 protein [Planctomycetota bacterium]